MTEGRFALIEQLRADGVRYIFGNPGTVEQGLLDALSSYPDLEYVLALQESVAVGIADGYARGSGQVAVVQLHSGVGLGNGIGMLYQAKRGHTPLVVLAGESGLRYDAMDAQMAADLVAMARPVTKYATRVVDPASVLRVVRRAMKIATTPPTGPVFVCLPADVMDAENDETPRPSSRLTRRVSPDPAELRRAAEMLIGAHAPIVIAGDGVGASHAQEELARLAELLGAPVWGADWSQVNMDYGHPLFSGLLGHMFGDVSRTIVSRADAVLIVGTYVFPEVFPALQDVFASGAPVVHIDLDDYEIAKNFEVTLGLTADPKLTLAALTVELSTLQSAEGRTAAEERVRAAGVAKDTRLAEERKQDVIRGRQSGGVTAAQFAVELARRLPSDAVVFDEALTTGPELLRYLVPRQPGSYHLTRGGSLGVGIPGAVGLKLAHPERTVVGFTGDGGAMYTIQALWTAVRHGIDAKFVVCNNRSYELLKDNLREYWHERGVAEHTFPSSFDLSVPPLNFSEIAQSMGVRAARVEKLEQVEPAIHDALDGPGPFLIELVLA